jgi:hypothetical protein
MALINTLFDIDDGPNDALTVRRRIRLFNAAMWFWAKGEITRAQVIAGLELQASDEAQLDELASHYQSLSVDDRRAFHSDLESATMLRFEGVIGDTLFKSFLGLT